MRDEATAAPLSKPDDALTRIEKKSQTVALLLLIPRRAKGLRSRAFKLRINSVTLIEPVIAAFEFKTLLIDKNIPEYVTARVNVEASTIDRASGMKNSDPAPYFPLTELDENQAVPTLELPPTDSQELRSVPQAVAAIVTVVEPEVGVLEARILFAETESKVKAELRQETGPNETAKHLFLRERPLVLLATLLEESQRVPESPEFPFLRQEVESLLSRA